MNPWITTVEGGAQSIDAVEVRRALGILIDPQGTHEIRFLPSGKSRPVRGDALDEAVKAIEALADNRGIYYTLNPVRPDLGDRAARVKDVLSRRWLLIDCDRPKAIEPDAMATDSEKETALKLAQAVLDFLTGEGWPMPVMTDSGNGAHILYRIDLPANDHSRILVSKTLKALAAKFGPEVDSKLSDACRIAKLPGTWVRKLSNTPERPWRMAHLLFVPETMQIVSVEMLERVAGIGPAQAPVPFPDLSWLTQVKDDPDKTGAYVRSAIEKELAHVALAPDGDRNNQLNKSAFALGQIVGAGLADREGLAKLLTHAALRSGLAPDETARTIESGLDSGALQPRVLPASVTKPSRNGVNGKHTPPPADKRLIILASEVTPRKVEWLWPNRIPIGKLTTFAGWGGLGKSFVTMDLASRISQGDEIPGMKGECFEVGNVLILNTEDDPDDTSVPRLIEAGADLTRIGFARSEVLGRFTLADLGVLDRMLTQLGGARLVVIDPATAHLGAANDHKNAELRALLSPLSLWAMARRVAVVMVTHVNKPQAGKVEAMARVVGSVAWVNAVRAAVMFARDPEDKNKRLFIPFKTNNSPEQRGLAYRVVPTDSLARVEWLGEVDTSADEAINTQAAKTVKQGLTGWLEDRFREKREWRCLELWPMAEREGFTGNAFFKSSLRSMIVKWKGSDGAWVWTAKEGWPQDTSESSESSEPCQLSPYVSTGFKDSGQHSGPVPGSEPSEGSEGSDGSDPGTGPECSPLVDPADMPEGWQYFSGGKRIK